MAGSKRKSGGGGSSSSKSASSDFKRIKAKVGKRAVKVNETDVSFKAASLRVTGQTLVEESNNGVITATNKNNKGDDTTESVPVLLSARGKTVDDLIIQLGHPASAVRASALKGIQDIVNKQQQQQSHKRLQPFLSALIPACIHTCVDDDEDVRSLGIDVVTALISPQEATTIQPFAPLLAARVASALHSLDAPTRIDGVLLAKRISTTFPSIMTSSVPRLLPPFVHLLSDPKTKKSLDDILAALVALLRAASNDIDANNGGFKGSSTNTSSSTTKVSPIEPDLVYVSGGRSRNAIVQPGRAFRKTRPRPIHSLSQLPVVECISSWLQDMDDINAAATSNPTKMTTPALQRRFELRNSLLENLRDILLESTNGDMELGTTGTGTSGLSDGRQNGIQLARIVVLLRAVRLLWRSYERDLEMKEKVSGSSEFEATARKILSLVMDSFPIAGGENESLDGETNAAIITTLLDASFSVPKSGLKKKSENEWLKMAVSHAVPRIDVIAAAPNVSSPDLNTSCKLIRYLGLHGMFPTALLQLLSGVRDRFFNKDDAKVARSLVGRKMALVMMELAGDDANLPCAQTESPTSDLLAKVVTQMPSHLEAWGDEFLYESQFVMGALSNIVRRSKENDNFPLIDELRNESVRLVSQLPGQARTGAASVLERYPVSLQRMSLSLIVMMRSPSDDMLKCLASICSRHWGNNNGVLTDDILDAMHSIRNTATMRGYIMFLISSIGLSNQIKRIKANVTTNGLSRNSFEKAAAPLDSALKSVSFILVQCGPGRVLPMLLPQLLSWLRATKGDGGGIIDSLVLLTKMRASLVVLGFISLSLNASPDGSSLFDIVPDQLSLHSLVDSLCTFLHCVTSNDVTMDLRSKLLSPMVGLMASDHHLLETLIQRICDWCQTTGLRKADQMNILQIVLEWITDSRLRGAVTKSCQRLLKQFQSLTEAETSESSEDLKSRAQQLTIATEIHGSV